MPDLVLVIEEELSDKRSNEFAYKLLIKNASGKPIELRSIMPRVPAGVELHEIKDISREEQKDKYTRLCKELTTLLAIHLQTEVDEYRSKATDILMEMLKAAVSFSTMWKLYVAMFSKEMRKNLARQFNDKADSLQFKIDSVQDAGLAYGKWFKDIGTNLTAKTLFEAKLEQLREIEKSIGVNVSASPLVHLDKEATYNRNYVITFKRGLIDQKKFSFLVDVCFISPDAEDEKCVSTSKTVLVSPNSLVTSMIAFLFALVGTAVQHVVDV
jgi:hypothetical protein